MGDSPLVTISSIPLINIGLLCLIFLPSPKKCDHPKIRASFDDLDPCVCEKGGTKQQSPSDSLYSVLST